MFVRRVSSIATRAQGPLTRGFASGSSDPLVKTAFYDFHLHLGGKMVPFAGYELPVQVRENPYVECRQSMKF